MAKKNKSLDGITEGARVIITGASTGMGKALALKRKTKAQKSS